MGLWEPGKIEGVTPAILLRVCTQAYKDHVGMELNWEPAFETEDKPPRTLDPLDMEINEIALVEGDQDFDRCSFARANEERFIDPGTGVEFEIADYHGNGSIGKPWRVQEPGYVRIEGLPEEGIGPSVIFTEKQIAEWLNAQNGPHPNPYVARVEVTYNERGHRAGYGVRKNGKLDIWYD